MPSRTALPTRGPAAHVGRSGRVHLRRKETKRSRCREHVATRWRGRAFLKNPELSFCCEGPPFRTALWRGIEAPPPPLVRSPCPEHDPADAHPSAHKSVLESANPRIDSEGASGCPWSTARATAPSPGRPTPGVVKQDKSSGGSVDTTKTRGTPSARPNGSRSGGAGGAGVRGRGYGEEREGAYVFIIIGIARGGGGVAQGLGICLFCLWRRLMASRHCSF